jgi:hypothetical protein
MQRSRHDPSPHERAARPRRPRAASASPSAFTVLFVVTVAVWLLASSSRPASTRPTRRPPVAGSYTQVDADLSFTDRLYQLLMAR